MSEIWWWWANPSEDRSWRIERRPDCGGFIAHIGHRILVVGWR